MKIWMVDLSKGKVTSETSALLLLSSGITKAVRLDCTSQNALIYSWDWVVTCMMS